MSEENKTIFRRYVEAVNTGNLALLDQILASDFVNHDPSLPPELQRGRDGQKQLISMFRSAFPDLHGDIEDMVAERDKVVCRLTWAGTHKGELMGIAPTGKRVTFPMIAIDRIAQTRMVEQWVVFDAMGMMQQIGAIPAPGQG